MSTPPGPSPSRDGDQEVGSIVHSLGPLADDVVQAQVQLIKHQVLLGLAGRVPRRVLCMGYARETGLCVHGGKRGIGGGELTLKHLANATRMGGDESAMIDAQCQQDAFTGL